jgi:hypothetical protein
MKSALIAAVVAVLVGSGSAMATNWINGSAIRPHSIPLNRLKGNLPTGFTKVFERTSKPVTVKPGQYASAAAPCPFATPIAGGFGYAANDGKAVQISGLTSGPGYHRGGSSTWVVTVQNTSSASMTIEAYAVCLKSSGAVRVG